MRSCVALGSLEQGLSYPIGRILDVSEGVWVMCLSSLSIEYTANVPPTFLSVSSNFVAGFEVSGMGQLVDKNVTLNVVFLRGNSGAKSIIGFRQRDFFEINNPQQDITIEFRGLDGSVVQGAKVFAHILLRRVR